MNLLGLPAILTGFVLVQLIQSALVGLARWQSRERPPVTVKLLRPPGEHQRIRLSVLDERIRWLLIATSTIPVIIFLLGALASADRKSEDHGLSIPILTGIGFVLTAGAGGYFLFRTFAERRSRARALQGH